MRPSKRFKIEIADDGAISKCRCPQVTSKRRNCEVAERPTGLAKLNCGKILSDNEVMDFAALLNSKWFW